MRIKELYIEKQKDNNWYENFSSTKKGSDGKFFSFFDTNFRKIESYYSQLKKAENILGKERKNWDISGKNGHERDKQRIVKLRKAGLIKLDHNGLYFYTEKAYEVIKIYEDENLNQKEKWILMLLLILDFSFNEKESPIFKVLELTYNLRKSDLKLKKNSNIFDVFELVEIFKKYLKIDNKDELFTRIPFWFITFYKDN